MVRLMVVERMWYDFRSALISIISAISVKHGIEKVRGRWYYVHV